MKTETENLHKGKVIVVLGPVVDVEFDGTYMPKIHEKLLVKMAQNNLSRSKRSVTCVAEWRVA